MTSLDTLIRPLAASMLAQYGKPVTFKSITKGAYDPATGTSSESATSTATFASLDSTSKQFLGYGFDAKDLVRGGDVFATIPAQKLPSAPKPGDLLTIDGWDYVVIRVMPTWSGAQVAVYELQVRK